MIRGRPSTQPTTVNGKLVFGTALTIGVLFFVAEHDWQASLRETFAATATEMELSVSGGSLTRRLAFVLLAVFGLVCFAHRSVKVSWKGLLPWAMTGYLVWCLLSVVWSEDPSLTVRRLITLGCFAVGAIGLGTRLELPELCRVVLLVAAAYVAGGVVTEVMLGTFRPWRPDYRFAGTIHPNSQALHCAIVCLASIAVRNQAPSCRMLWLASIPATILLILTGSRTGCAALLAAVAAHWLVRCSWRAKAAAACAMAAATPFVLLACLLSGYDLLRNAEQIVLLGRDDHAESLTGRVPLWEELAEYARSRPWLGYGYSSFWDPDHIYAISSTLKWGISEAHNAYLESILSVGLVGTLLLLLALLLAAGRAALRYRTTQLAGYDFLFAMLVLGFVNALLESGMILLQFVPFAIAAGVSHLALRAPKEDHA